MSFFKRVFFTVTNFMQNLVHRVLEPLPSFFVTCAAPFLGANKTKPPNHALFVMKY